MEINILYFLLFSAITVSIFYCAPAKMRKYVLLAANILFYWNVAGAGPFILLVLLALYTWFAAEWVRGKGKGMLLITLTPVIGSLAVCKYLPFFAEGISAGLARFGLGVSASVFRFALPLGISFYALKLVSYLIERHRGQLDRPGLVEFLVYAMNFTQILCGPIQRPGEFLSQFPLTPELDRTRFSMSVYRILLGLFKKLVIANRCAPYAAVIFANPEGYPSAALWLAAFLFSIELYADFSGYSDLAVGLQGLLGLKTSENFRQPYFSVCIREFWTRWHISLSSWLRDYVYIPLGGSRCSPARHRLNLLVTFAVSGMWHGSSWNYMLWGLLHGLFNMLSPSKERMRKLQAKPLLRVLSSLATFCTAAFAWIIFNAGSVENAAIYIRHMFMEFSLSYSALSLSLLPFSYDNTCVVFALILFVFIFLLFLYDLLEYRQAAILKKAAFGIVWQTVLIVSVLLFGIFGESGFLYAQF